MQEIRPVVLYLGDHDPSGINMPRVAERDICGRAVRAPSSITSTKFELACSIARGSTPTARV
jgi:hypothetical protein